MKNNAQSQSHVTSGQVFRFNFEVNLYPVIHYLGYKNKYIQSPLIVGKDGLKHHNMTKKNTFRFIMSGYHMELSNLEKVFILFILHTIQKHFPISNYFQL